VQSKVKVFVALYRQRLQMQRQVEALEKSRTELHATQVELQRLLQVRDEFMSMVAHELRTPLNTLLLETQMRKMHLDKGNVAAFSAEQLRPMIARESVVQFLAGSTDKDNRYMARLFGPAHQFGQFEAIHAGHVDIEDGQRKFMLQQ
jgi:signal transduction histidine kinase